MGVGVLGEGLQKGNSACVSASVSFSSSIYCPLQIHATSEKHGKTFTGFMIGLVSTFMAEKMERVSGQSLRIEMQHRSKRQHK